MNVSNEEADHKMHNKDYTVNASFRMDYYDVCDLALPFPFPLLGLAKREGLISSGCFPFTERRRSALSLTVPPHFRPMDCSVTLSLSPPAVSNSSTLSYSSSLIG